MGWAYKPYVNCNVDEVTIAQELQKKFKKPNVFVAIKDIGIDLILIPNIEAKT